MKTKPVPSGHGQQISELIIQYRASASETQREAVRINHDLMRIKTLAGKKAEVVQIDPLSPLSDVIAEIRKNPSVLSVQPNYRYAATVNDPYYGYLWGLTNIAQDINGSIGILDIDMDVPEAWAHTRGASEIVVAVIDTGVDLNHPDLAANIWTNPGEIPYDGLDNDQNGYIDDVHGWDFIHNASVPYYPGDDETHGTHVAGTIAATADNSLGIAGVAPGVRIMPLKILGADGGSTSDALDAIRYAQQMGADLINASWGGSEYDTLLRQAIVECGLPFIAAAGNKTLNLDLQPAYPAAFDCTNIISVAAVSNRGELAAFSNYGAQSVDVGAPGVGILSTTPGNTYSWMHGTSMAAPNVSGVVALMLSIDPDLTGSELRQVLMDTVVPLTALSGRCVTGGLVNAERAVAAVLAGAEDTTPPAVTATLPMEGTIHISPDIAVTIDFSKPIQPGDTFSQIQIKQGSQVLSASLEIQDHQLIIEPAAPLPYGSAITAQIPANALEDLTGNPLASGFSLHFSTASLIQVHFDSQGGSLVSSIQILSGSKIARPVDPTRADFEFIGWYQDAQGSMPWSFASDIMTIEKTLFAKWAPAWPTTGIEGFITRFYQLCLGRDPDNSGLNYWVNLLQTNQKTGADIASDFIQSPEFRGMNKTDDQYISIMYRVFFNREPDEGGISYWKSQLGNGLSRYWVLTGFVNSQEFLNVCLSFGIDRGSLSLSAPADLYPQVTAFVTRFYKLCLVRMPDDSGVNYWVTRLKSGQSTGASLAYDFVFSTEFVYRNVSNPEFVNIMYAAFYDRAPDYGGYTYWLNRLSSGASRRDVLVGFVDSTEFLDLCNTFQITRGSIA